MKATIESCRRRGCLPTNKFGGSGGRYFSYGCPHQRLSKIEIWTGNGIIRGLRTNYNHQRFGEGNSRHVINLKKGENIIGAIIKTGNWLNYGQRLKLLAFLTRYNNRIYKYGPYGSGSGPGTTRIILKNIVSFFGRCGGDIDAIGFYYRP